MRPQALPKLDLGIDVQRNWWRREIALLQKPERKRRTTVAVAIGANAELKLREAFEKTLGTRKLPKIRHSKCQVIRGGNNRTRVRLVWNPGARAAVTAVGTIVARRKLCAGATVVAIAVGRPAAGIAAQWRGQWAGAAVGAVGAEGAACEFRAGAAVVAIAVRRRIAGVAARRRRREHPRAGAAVGAVGAEGAI